jgi:hypothetical protein
MAKRGGKDKGETNTSGSAALEAFAKEMQEMSRPVREETFSQVLEGLKTGGIGARIPMITSAVEASPGATSNALRQIDDQNALMGTSGTFTGQRARADALMSGEQRTAQLPTGVSAGIHPERPRADYWHTADSGAGLRRGGRCPVAHVRGEHQCGSPTAGRSIADVWVDGEDGRDVLAQKITQPFTSVGRLSYGTNTR